MSTLMLLALVIIAAIASALIVVRNDRGDEWERYRPLTNEERVLRWADRLAEHEAERRRAKARQAQRVAQRLDHRAAERARVM